LAAVDDLRGRIGTQTALKRALTKLGNRWDVVLIDCPPNLGLLSVNALAAADEVLVPVETHGIAAIGLRDLVRTIEDARESPVNPTLAIGAIVATRFNRRKEANDCTQQTREDFPLAMLQTVVRESAPLGKEAA
jgi:chromosome partitioning protein